MSTSKEDIFDEASCKMAGLYLSTSYETMASQVIFVVILGKLSYAILRRIYMPRLLSDMLVSTFQHFGILIKPIINAP